MEQASRKMLAQDEMIVGTVWPHLRAKVSRRRLKKATPGGPKKEAPGIKFRLPGVKFRPPGSSKWASGLLLGRLGRQVGLSGAGPELDDFGGHFGAVLGRKWHQHHSSNAIFSTTPFSRHRGRENSKMIGRCRPLGKLFFRGRCRVMPSLFVAVRPP